MHVLLAGGTGYVGKHVLAALRLEGHDVTVFSRNASRGELGGEARRVDGDIRDAAQVSRAVVGHDAVVNCVGLIRNRRSKGQTFRAVVLHGTQNLVAACRKANVGRFVLVSANGVRKDGTDYQTTKWAAEQTVRGSGIPWTILRPSIVYAADDDFTNRFRGLLRLGAAPYFGKGDYALAPVHADDLARVVARSLTLDAAKDKVFHVCGPETLSYKELLRTIKRLSGSRGLVLPFPRGLIRLAAFFLGWLPFFPATNDMLSMLFAGNTCTEHEWVRVFGVQPTAFTQGAASFLAASSHTNDK